MPTRYIPDNVQTVLAASKLLKCVSHLMLSIEHNYDEQGRGTPASLRFEYRVRDGLIFAICPAIAGALSMRCLEFYCGNTRLALSVQRTSTAQYPLLWYPSLDVRVQVRQAAIAVFDEEGSFTYEFREAIRVCAALQGECKQVAAPEEPVPEAATPEAPPVVDHAQPAATFTRASYVRYHAGLPMGYVDLDKPKAVRVDVAGEKRMTRAEVDFWGDLFAAAVRNMTPEQKATALAFEAQKQPRQER